MKWAILSDIHANLEALRAVIDDLRAVEAHRIVCLGDIVGYGADANLCLRLLRGETGEIVAGNHDCAAAGLTDLDSFQPTAREAVLWTRKELSPAAVDFLRTLPLARETEGMTFVHATPEDPAGWAYLLSPGDAAAGFRAMAGQVGFVGHSHRPLIWAEREGRSIELLDGEGVRLQRNTRYLFNVGSVGQPRDGDCRAAYGLYDDSSGEFLLRRVSYDIQAAADKITRAGLPPSLALRLFAGR